MNGSADVNTSIRTSLRKSSAIGTIRKPSSARQSLQPTGEKRAFASTAASRSKPCFSAPDKSEFVRSGFRGSPREDLRRAPALDGSDRRTAFSRFGVVTAGCGELPAGASVLPAILRLYDLVGHSGLEPEANGLRGVMLIPGQVSGDVQVLGGRGWLGIRTGGDSKGQERTWGVDSKQVDGCGKIAMPESSRIA